MLCNYCRFMYLIDGRAESEIESYVTEQHTFEEFSVKVKFFDNLGKELTDSLPKEVNLGMFSLHCEDLILNLYRKTGVLRELILKVKSMPYSNFIKLDNNYNMYSIHEMPYFS